MAKHKMPQAALRVGASNLPKVLRFLIGGQDLTQVQLAQKVGIGSATLQGWLGGRFSPRFDLLCDLLDALGKRLIIVDKEWR